MSRIYFHFDNGHEIEVAGMERAHMGLLIDDLTFPCYGWRSMEDEDRLIDCMDDYRRGSWKDRREGLRLWCRALMGNASFSLPDGRKIDVWSCSLNTAHAIGQPCLRLFARLHAQCEMHCWASSRSSFDGIACAIQQGLECGMYRRGMGWEELLSYLGVPHGGMLDDETMVCSYSVCDSFPNPDLAGATCECESDKWYDKPDKEKWREAFAALKKERPQLRIEDLRDPYWFNHDCTAFDVRRIAEEVGAAAT